MGEEKAMTQEVKLDFDKILEAFTVEKSKIDVEEIQARYHAAVTAIREMAIPDRNKRNIIESLYYSMRDELSSSVSSPNIWGVLYQPEDVVKPSDLGA